MQAFIKTLDMSKNIFFIDPWFCLENVRKDAEVLLGKMKWIFFENNAKKALANVKNRNDNRKISNLTINFFSKQYKPPKNALKIWNGNE